MPEIGPVTGAVRLIISSSFGLSSLGTDPVPIRGATSRYRLDPVGANLAQELEDTVRRDLGPVGEALIRAINIACGRALR